GMTFERRSESFILGTILRECRRRIPSRTVQITLHVRDVRPVREAHPTVVESRVLLEIAGNPGDPRASGDVSIRLPDLLMSKMLSIVTKVSQHSYMIDPYDDPKILSVHVGPPELAGKTWRRTAYLVPETMRSSMISLPTMLELTGASIAYDPKATVLVVIDEQEGLVFTLLQTLGFVPLGP
ncbi:MAG: hypothetical protein AAB728_02835, partial [Patescibacteria group bacterium]